jgi:hypothetical protein
MNCESTDRAIGLAYNRAPEENRAGGQFVIKLPIVLEIEINPLTQ